MAQHVYVVEYCSYEGECSVEGVYVSEDIAKAYATAAAKEYMDVCDNPPEQQIKEDVRRGGEWCVFVEDGNDQMETWTIYRTALVDTMPEEIK